VHLPAHLTHQSCTQTEKSWHSCYNTWSDRYPHKCSGCINDISLHQPALPHPWESGCYLPRHLLPWYALYLLPGEAAVSHKDFESRFSSDSLNRKQPDSSSGPAFAARNNRGPQNLCPSSTFVKTLSQACSHRKKLSFIQDLLQDFVAGKAQRWYLGEDLGHEAELVVGKDRCHGI